VSEAGVGVEFWTY